MTDQTHVPFDVHKTAKPSEPAGEGAPRLPGFAEIHTWVITGASPEDIQTKVAADFDHLKAWAGDDPERIRQAEIAYFESIRQLSNVMLAYRGVNK